MVLLDDDRFAEVDKLLALFHLQVLAPHHVADQLHQAAVRPPPQLVPGNQTINTLNTKNGNSRKVHKRKRQKKP